MGRLVRFWKSHTRCFKKSQIFLFVCFFGLISFSSVHLMWLFGEHKEYHSFYVNYELSLRFMYWPCIHWYISLVLHEKWPNLASDISKTNLMSCTNGTFPNMADILFAVKREEADPQTKLNLIDHKNYNNFRMTHQATANWSLSTHMVSVVACILFSGCQCLRCSTFVFCDLRTDVRTPCPGRKFGQ